ncbi:MAG: ComEC family competence protein [Ruminococcaceae bacterium]|nr:ComEC family competence protein [Oscillospiraceae bacterium]
MCRLNLFQNRPLAFASFLSVAIVLAAFYANLPRRWIFSAIALFFALILLVVALFRRKCGKRQSILILTCLLAAVLLFSSWNFFNRQVDYWKERADETVTVEGVVSARINSGASQSFFTLQLDEIDGNRIRQTILLQCEYSSALRAGERVRLMGKVDALPMISEDPDIAFYIADGISGILVCSDFEDCTVVSSGELSIWIKLAEWNTALSEKLIEWLGNREGGLAAALVLGNRSFLSAMDKLAFRRVGISHFLALSGLHVGILILAVERFLCLLRIPRRGRIIMVVILSIGYLAVTGASVSTVRAVCMATILSVAFFLRRRYDSQTAIFAVLFGILAIEPYAIADVGLWLSFLAAGGIIVFVPAVREALANKKLPKRAIHPIKRMGKALLLSISVGLFAFSATLPLSALLFGEVSILSVPATLVLSPLLSVVLILSALCLLVPVSPVFFLAEKSLWFLYRIVSAVSEWREITVRTQDRVTLILIAVLAVLLFLCAVLKFRKKLFAAVPLVLIIPIFLSAYSVHWFALKEVRTEYFSQKSNEYLLFSSAGKAVAVDCSGGNKNYAQALAEGVHSAGCTELEELILTHYHSPVTYLLGRIAEKMKVRVLLLPTPENEEEAAVAERIAEEAAILGISCKIADESSAVAGLTVRWMHDAGMEDPAITLVAETEKTSLVWCNSQFSSAKQFVFFRKYAANADIFLFGQHGSNADVRRELPELTAKQIFVGEWKRGATPFLPSENTFYTTVSGKIEFSLP